MEFDIIAAGKVQAEADRRADMERTRENFVRILSELGIPDGVIQDGIRQELVGDAVYVLDVPPIQFIASRDGNEAQVHQLCPGCGGTRLLNGAGGGSVRIGVTPGNRFGGYTVASLAALYEQYTRGHNGGDDDGRWTCGDCRRNARAWVEGSLS